MSLVLKTTNVIRAANDEEKDGLTNIDQRITRDNSKGLTLPSTFGKLLTNEAKEI